MSQPVPVAILALPESSASVICGMFDLFRAAGREWNALVHGTPGPDLFAPRVVSRTGEPFRTANGVVVTPDARLDGPAPFEVVCVPDLVVGPDEVIAGRFEPEVAFLRRSAEAGAIVTTACSGALLFAETGLLAGQDATTHWAYCDTLRRRHPTVRVHHERALVVAGPGQRWIMAGGGTSWLDVTLYVIARTAGIEPAMQLARANLIDWHHIGQQPFARVASTRQVEDAVVAKAQLWVAEHYDERAPVATMVELSGLPERTFSRRFTKATGMSPLAYVHALRIEEAKQVLETTDAKVDEVAREVGYDDPAYFARLFKKHVQLTPLAYRRRFGSLRAVLRASRPRH